MSNSSMRYDAPPITEAVIELRFDKHLSDNELKEAKGQFRRLYPHYEDGVQSEYIFNVEEEELASLKKTPKCRFFGDDGRHLIVIAPDSVSVSILAPYRDWDELRALAQDAWTRLRKLSGFRKLTRTGVRFVNRLDIKMIDKTVDFEDYLTLRINLPNDFYPLQAYDLSMKFEADDVKSTITVRSAALEPVILDHGAFLLDIDISRSFDLPQKEVEVFEYLDLVRAKKNELFETFITDKSREIFNG